MTHNSGMVPPMTTIELSAQVTEQQIGLRLDQACAQLFPDYSRSQIQSWIKAGDVSIDQKVCKKPREKVQHEQTIHIATTLVAQDNWAAQEIPLNIVHADDSLIIINKPIGLVVHPGAGNPDKTLVNALIHHYPELAELPRAGIIHRLDKNTSGLLVIARNLKAHHALTKELQAREVHREYLALVYGEMISGGTINEPIGRDANHRIKMSITHGGREAITHYRIEERFSRYTLLRVQLDTGRTHQIRVHLTHINYPIVGDKIYGKRQNISPKITPELQSALKKFHHQALHATKLGLTHPDTQEPMSWEVPPPNDMQELITLMRDNTEHAKLNN